MLNVGDFVEVHPGVPVVGRRGMIVAVLDGDFYEVVNINVGGELAGRPDVDPLPGHLLTKFA